MFISEVGIVLKTNPVTYPPSHSGTTSPFYRLACRRRQPFYWLLVSRSLSCSLHSHHGFLANHSHPDLTLTCPLKAFSSTTNCVENAHISAGYQFWHHQLSKCNHCHHQIKHPGICICPHQKKKMLHQKGHNHRPYLIFVILWTPTHSFGPVKGTQKSAEICDKKLPRDKTAYINIGVCTFWWFFFLQISPL